MIIFNYEQLKRSAFLQSRGLFVFIQFKTELPDRGKTSMYLSKREKRNTVPSISSQRMLFGHCRKTTEELQLSHIMYIQFEEKLTSKVSQIKKIQLYTCRK